MRCLLPEQTTQGCPVSWQTFVAPLCQCRSGSLWRKQSSTAIGVILLLYLAVIRRLVTHCRDSVGARLHCQRSPLPGKSTSVTLTQSVLAKTACATALLRFAGLRQRLRTNCTPQVVTNLIQPHSLHAPPSAEIWMDDSNARLRTILVSSSFVVSPYVT